MVGLLMMGCEKESTQPAPAPPLCEITSPADSQAVADEVIITVDASSEIGLLDVSLFIDDSLHQVWDEEPFVHLWNTRVYPDSSFHTLWAVAMDVDNVITVSDTVQVMVDFSRGVGQSLLLVANYNGGAGTLSFIDLLSGDALTRDVIGVGIVPNDLIWNGLLFVVNSMSHDLNVIYLSYSNELTEIGSGDLGLAQNRSPQHGAIADNGYLYASNFNLHDVTVMELEAFQPLVFIPVGRSPADVLALGDKVYVCNSGFDPVTWEYDDPGTVSVISTSVDRVVNSIEVGVNPQFMALDPLGRLHIVCTGNYDDKYGEVWIIDPTSGSVVQVVNLGGSPGEIAITEDGYAYLAAGGWQGEPGKVFRYNAVTGHVRNGPNNPIEVTTGASRVVAAEDNSVFVACFDGDRVDKIVGDARIASYAVGDGPGAMVIIDR